MCVCPTYDNNDDVTLLNASHVTIYLFIHVLASKPTQVATS
jgi:hypothetical protein